MIVTQTTGDPKVVTEGDWVSIDGTTGEVVEGAHRDEAVRGPPGPPRQDARRRDEPGLPPLRDAHGVGRQGAPPEGPRERRPARPGRERRRVRRRGHRPLPHRAHVLRRRAHHGGARDDPRRTRPRTASARSTSSSRCSARTSSASSGRWAPRPVTIRLLDPPLHEFLPHGEKERESVARQTGVDAAPRSRARSRTSTR